MPDTNINLVDDSLKVLLQAGTDFPNAEIDFCVGYVTASGVLLLKKMFNTAHKARAVVGLCVQNKAYAIDDDIERKLVEIEKNLGANPPELEYKKRLSALGIKPKMQTQHSIPLESQEAALETLFEFVKNTRLEYAYQMLLLLTL